MATAPAARLEHGVETVWVGKEIYHYCVLGIHNSFPCHVQLTNLLHCNCWSMESVTLQLNSVIFSYQEKLLNLSVKALRHFNDDASR